MSRGVVRAGSRAQAGDLRIIAAVAIGVGVTFFPLGMLAGLSLPDALNFAIGLLVANVPEGLLPTITLALAVGVRVLTTGGAVVKRLSAVETLGSTTVICACRFGTAFASRTQFASLRAIGPWSNRLLPW